ncbi:hypothetical protein GIB67_041730 [Kingdonia uniflora]|uniref:Uncharacterized protein n=1 Tax=Kingdonia uniflora TaxID=39325 RepID=A0A7J7NNV3_9MAGN|nr:hypothetical protein GIB67_041730 [Kingdonia uniflora]
MPSWMEKFIFLENRIDLGKLDIQFRIAWFARAAVVIEIWRKSLGVTDCLYSVSHGGDYLYLLPDLAKEKKCRHLGDEVSLEYVQGVVKDSRTDGFCGYLAQFAYGLTLPLSNLAKSVMNLIGVCPTQFNCNFWEVIFVCKTLNGRWAASSSEKRITAKNFLEYYAVKYVTATNGAYLCSSSVRPCFFDLSSAGRVWNDNLLWVSGECLQRSDEEPLELNNRTITKGINCKVSSKESLIDVVAWEGTELEAVLKELEISSMEEKLTTSKLNIPLKLARLNEIFDGLVDMATVSSTVVQNLAKRKAVKRGAAPCFVSSVSVDDSSKRRKVKADLLEEQCRANSREKMVAVMDDEFKKLEEKVTREKVDFLLEREKDKEAAALKLKQVRAKSDAEAERLVTTSAISRNNLAGKLYQLRYIKAEITAFSEWNYEEMEIMDEEEVEEREGGLNTAKKTDANNQETINQIENSRLRVVDLEGLLKYRKNPSLNCRLDRFEADLPRLKVKEAQSKAELVEIQAKNQNLADDWIHARGTELRVRELKYPKYLKFELDKRDYEITPGEGSREMKEFLRRNEELVENIRIDLANSRQMSIELTRQMSERID